MARGLYRRTVAGIGFTEVDFASSTPEPFIYADNAAWNAAWTQHLPPGTDSTSGSINPNAPAAGTIELDWNGGGGVFGVSDQYYERTFSGFTPGARYHVSVHLKNLGGFSIDGHNVFSAAGEFAKMPVGGQGTVSVLATADGSGDIAVTVGVYSRGSIANGNLFVSDLIFTSIDGTPSSQLLTFYFDQQLSWPVPRAGSVLHQSEDGYTRAGGLTGIDYTMRGTARRIPKVGGVLDDGQTISGWDDDPGGWQRFLAAAMDKAPLTFYPMAANLAVSVAPAFWTDPLDFSSAITTDGPGRWQLEFTLRSPTTPFEGY